MTTTGRRSTIVLFVLCAATLPFGCVKPGSERPPTGSPPQTGSDPAEVQLGVEFSLKRGQRGAVEGEPFAVKFASVANDSRCPTGAQCVWAGNAEVLIEADANGSSATLKLHTHGGTQYPKEAEHQQYRVELIVLRPHPSLEPQSPAPEILVTLVIRKARE
jgi:hypothetical protein